VRKLGKSKERVAAEDRWWPKIDKIIDLAFSKRLQESVEVGLDVMATAIRSAESLISRSKFLAGKLREMTKSWMLEEGITISHRERSQTMLRLDAVLKIMKNRDGRRQKNRIIKMLGLTKDEGDRLIKENRKVIPRRVETTFTIDNDVLEELDEDGTMVARIDEYLGNPPQLYVGPWTKTDKEGKPPKRRQ
jgi:hypothetical protein